MSMPPMSILARLITSPSQVCSSVRACGCHLCPGTPGINFYSGPMAGIGYWFSWGIWGAAAPSRRVWGEGNFQNKAWGLRGGSPPWRAKINMIFFVRGQIPGSTSFLGRTYGRILDFSFVGRTANCYETALRLVSGTDFRSLLHHSSSLTRLKGSWGQVWPENGPKTKH